MLQEKYSCFSGRIVFKLVIKTLGTSAANPLQTRSNNVKKGKKETGVRENFALSTHFTSLKIGGREEKIASLARC